MTAKTKEKTYARLNTAYRDLLVPLDLLERVVAECHLVRTTYTDGKHIITMVEPLTKFDIQSQADLDAGIVQTELERES
jgi:hypothetical protein